MKPPPELPPQVAYHLGHIRTSAPVLKLAVFITGGLAAMAIGGGIVAIVWNSVSPTELDFFGAKLTTGHVGVAFVGLGLAALVSVVRRILATLERLGALE